MKRSQEDIGQISTVLHEIKISKMHYNTTKVGLSLEMPGFEPGTFHMRSERSTTELHPLTPRTLAAKCYIANALTPAMIVSSLQARNSTFVRQVPCASAIKFPQHGGTHHVRKSGNKLLVRCKFCLYQIMCCIQQRIAYICNYPCLISYKFSFKSVG